MSVVSGIVLIMSCCEESVESEDDVGDDTYPLIDEINGWLKDKNHLALKSVEEYFGGGKHPQMIVHGAGLNHFGHLHDAFIDFVLSRPWSNPENLVLIIQPEEGETIVRRAT